MEDEPPKCLRILPTLAAAVVGQRYNKKVGGDLAGRMGAKRGAETADEEESLASRNRNRRRWHDSLYKWRLSSTAG